LAEGWDRLGSERLLTNRYFSVRSDRLRLPDGGIKDPYYVIERPDAAIVFPLTGAGEVVLVRQYRPPLEMMELGLPAGLVEEGENSWAPWPPPPASRTTGPTCSWRAASR
jgi:ADP-ribose pyrophosphatase